jgi:peroxiredoxin
MNEGMTGPRAAMMATAFAAALLCSAAAHADDTEPRQAPYANPSPAEVGTLAEGLGIAVGERAPDSEVHDSAGRPVRLQELWRSGPILLVFYRGGWCPFCNRQIHDLATASAEYQQRGVRPVAVSVDRMDQAAKTRATYSIGFPVLSDPDLTAHRAYRVVHHVEEAEYARLQGYGIDLEKASDRMHHAIAVPSIFLIDAKGIVRWAHANPDYKVRPSTSQILAAIDRQMLGTP